MRCPLAELVGLVLMFQFEWGDEAKVGAVVTAKDIRGYWKRAEVVATDAEKNQVKLHWSHYIDKLDEWIAIDDSDRIRKPTAEVTASLGGKILRSSRRRVVSTKAF